MKWMEAAQCASQGRVFLVIATLAMSLAVAGCAEEPFDEIDANGDGKISESEWNASPTAVGSFSTLDTNGDGFITPDEFGDVGNETTAFAYIEASPDNITVNQAVPVGQETTYTSTLQNTGGKDLIISQITFDYPASQMSQDELEGIPAYRLESIVGCNADGCNTTWTKDDVANLDEAIAIGSNGLPYSAVQINVIFHRPETSTPRVATVTVKSNADISPTKQIIFETAEGNARIKVIPPELDFGSVGEEEDPTLPVTLQNIGSDTLQIYEIQFAGSDFFSIEIDGVSYDSGQVITLDPPLEVPQNTNYPIPVTFSPTNADPSTGSLHIITNDATAPPSGVEVILKGNTTGPCINVNPKTLNFGGKVIGQVSVLPIEIQSCGNEQLVITGIGWDELSSPDFSLDFTQIPGFEDNSSPSADNPLVIPINQKVDLDVRFVPDGENPKDEQNQPIPDIGHIQILNNTFDTTKEVKVTGIGVDVNCPVAVIQILEGEQVIPQTILHLVGDQSYSPSGNINKWEWSVAQPLGSQSLFLPSANFPDPTFETNVAGSYEFQLMVWDDQDTPSCTPAISQVVVIPDEAIHVELLWNTPNDPDQTDEGPEAGADVDLHFLHPYASGPDLDGDGEPDGWFDQPFDCFWFNPNPQWASYDPAVDDDPGLDRDDTDGAGPENLNLNIPEPNSTYRVGVHYWHDHNYGPSYATVRVYIYAQLVYELTDVQLLNHDMWDVASIDWPSGNVSQVCSPVSPAGQCLPKITPNYENPFFFQP